VQTGSRLHFGLLSLASAGEQWPDHQGEATIPARRFGGVGLMIEAPGTVIRAHSAPEWSAEGPLAERALAFARQFARSLEDSTGWESAPQHLVIEQAPPEHAGLGSGTQLGLAVGRVLADIYALTMSAAQLARRVGRGARSALGVHGFEQGGLLVEGGKLGENVAPLIARFPFPQAWRVVVIVPAGEAGLHGGGEQQAFTRLAGRYSVRAIEGLCRLVLLGLLPALAEEDVMAFGEALFDFNVRAGEAFASEQGGIYAGPAVAGIVHLLRGQGVRGVGQSSWGPAVFAVVGDEEEAIRLARWIEERLGSGAQVWVTRGRNGGASVAEV
jgi:beta-RFAP synthase